MPIYFDKFKLLNKLTFSLFKIYLNANNMYLLSSFIKLIFSPDKSTHLYNFKYFIFHIISVVSDSYTLYKLYICELWNIIKLCTLT